MRSFLFLRVALVLAALAFIAIPSDAEAGRRRCRSCSCPSVSASSAPAPYFPGVQEIGASAEPSQFRCANGRCVLIKPAQKAVAPATAKPAAPIKSTQATKVNREVITASNDSLRALGERIRDQFSNLKLFAGSQYPPRTEKPEFLPDAPQLANVELSDTPDLE